jgi:hypothetical protein
MEQSTTASSVRAPGEIEYVLNLWRNVHNPLPLEISHYTDATGLHGIITSGQLWATHINYLNDLQEFRYARQIIGRVLDEYARRAEGVELQQRLTKLRGACEANFAHWENNVDPYVVCFCEDGNLLSQWRAYGANGSGFSLQFTPTRLETLKKDTEVSANAKLLNVLYDQAALNRRYSTGLACALLLTERE